MIMSDLAKFLAENQKEMKRVAPVTKNHIKLLKTPTLRQKISPLLERQSQ